MTNSDSDDDDDDDQWMIIDHWVYWLLSPESALKTWNWNLKLTTIHRIIKFHDNHPEFKLNSRFVL